MYLNIDHTSQAHTCRRNIGFSVTIPRLVFMVLSVLPCKIPLLPSVVTGLGSEHSIQI